ncbi:MAG: hypothetical protein IJ091_07580 [Oscillospiraceae bacterium]|nr:hypothetical protein [Oscillospiraceae bacterium]
MTEHFRPTPQWLTNVYTQKTSDEPVLVWFEEEGELTYFVVEDDDNNVSRYPVDETVLYGDYIFWENRLVLFDQGTINPHVENSRLYVFAMDGELIGKTVFDPGIVFSSVSGIVGDKDSMDLYFLTEYHDVTAKDSNPEEWTLIKVSLINEKPAIQAIKSWDKLVVISGCEDGAILFKTDYDPKSMKFRKEFSLAI